MHRAIFCFLLFVCSFGCKQKNTQEHSIHPPSRTLEEQQDPNEPFYPFIDFIHAQVAYVDSTPFAIEKIVTINDKTIDSNFISKSDFKLWASEFTAIDPNHASIKPKYKETSLQDLSINRITFSINAIDPNLPLQQADVLVNPENEKVKTVILRRIWEKADSTVSQHLVWIDNRHFQISETIFPKDKEPYTRVTKVIWDRDIE